MAQTKLLFHKCVDCPHKARYECFDQYGEHKGYRCKRHADSWRIRESNYEEQRSQRYKLMPRERKYNG